MDYKLGSLVQYNNINYVILKIDYQADVEFLTIKNVLTQEILKLESAKVMPLDVLKIRREAESDLTEASAIGPNDQNYDQLYNNGNEYQNDVADYFDLSELTADKPDLVQESMKIATKPYFDATFSDLKIIGEIEKGASAQHLNSAQPQQRIVLPKENPTLQPVKPSTPSARPSLLFNINESISTPEFKAQHPINPDPILKTQPQIPKQMIMPRTFDQKQDVAAVPAANKHIEESLLRPKKEEKFSNKVESSYKSLKKEISKDLNEKNQKVLTKNHHLEPTTNQKKEGLNFDHENLTQRTKSHSKSSISLDKLNYSEETKLIFGEDSADEVLKQSRVWRRIKKETTFLVLVFCLFLVTLIAGLLLAIFQFYSINNFYSTEPITLDYLVNQFNTQNSVDLLASILLLIAAPVTGFILLMFSVFFVVKNSLKQYKKIAFYELQLKNLTKKQNVIIAHSNENTALFIKNKAEIKTLVAKIRQLEEELYFVKAKNNITDPNQKNTDKNNSYKRYH